MRWNPASGLFSEGSAGSERTSGTASTPATARTTSTPATARPAPRRARALWLAALAPIAFVVSAATTLVACGSDADSVSSGTADAGPTADGGGGTTTAGLPCDVDAILAKNCRSCHGSSPQFGAPNALVTDADLKAPAASDPSKSVYELVVQRIADDAKPMPPSPNARLSDADRATLTSWVNAGAPAGDGAACSTTDPKPVDIGVNCKPDVSVGPASAWEMPAVSGEQYVCYGVDLQKDTPTHVTGFVPRVDNAKIVHHIVLFESDSAYPSTPQECNPGGSIQWRMVMAWAPGGKGLELPPEAGFPIKPTGTHWVVQMHYSNAGGLSDQKDTSGFDVCTSPPRPNEADVLAFGTQQFSIPPASGAYSRACSISVRPEFAGIHLIASMPHMHTLGTGMTTSLQPAGGGAPKDLGTVNNWSFDNQAWLPVGTTVAADDKITTTCTWVNTTGATVSFGEKTTEEMCYSFTLYYPKISALPGGIPGWSWAFPALVSTCK